MIPNKTLRRAIEAYVEEQEELKKNAQSMEDVVLEQQPEQQENEGSGGGEVSDAYERCLLLNPKCSHPRRQVEVQRSKCLNHPMKGR